MNIKEKKERMPDVMAIYIVLPTEENLEIIKNDLNQGIFDNFYLNFVERPEDIVFQNFFSEIISTNKYSRIYKISVHPLNYIMYHPKVFSLNVEDSYKFLNSPNIKESDFNDYFKRIGVGLFDLLFSFRSMPLIKYRQNWFAEGIVSIIQDNFNFLFDKFPEMKEEFPRKNKSLLILLDRDTDLPIMFHHSGSLGSILNDLLGISRMKSNSVFEIDPHIDYIWNNFISTDYPTAHEKISEDLRQIVDQMKFLNSKNKNADDIDKVTEKIKSTLDNYKDINMKQAVLENHGKSAEKIGDNIKSRFINKFYDLEFSMLSSRKLTKEMNKTLSDILALKSNHNSFKNDCARLLLMVFLVQPKLSEEEINALENYFKTYPFLSANDFNTYNIDKQAFSFLRQKRAFEDSIKKSDNSNDQSGGIWSYMAGKSRSILKGVSSLMTSEQPSQVANIVNSLASQQFDSNYVSYSVMKKSIIENSNESFDQIIVFMVGGGCLSEFEYIDQLLIQNRINV
jgi:hypothetical protein